MRWRAATSVILGGLLWLVPPLTARAHESAEDHRDGRGRDCSEAENWWQDEDGHWHYRDENWCDRPQSDDRDQSHHDDSDDRDRRHRQQNDDRGHHGDD